MSRLTPHTRMIMLVGLTLIAAASSCAGVVPRDFLGGIGGFEWSADTTYVAGYPSWHFGHKAAEEDDSVAAGWFRETGSTVDPGSNCVYRIAPDGIDGTNCQYFALKNITSGNARASLVTSVSVGERDRQLHCGDVVWFVLDGIRMDGFDDVDAVCKMRIRFDAEEGKGSVWAEDVVLPRSKTSFKARMSARVPESVVPGDDSSKVVRATFWITIQTSGSLGTAEPGVYVDGAHLYVDRDADGLYDTETVPVETNRMIKTNLLYYDPDEHDARDTAQTYDIVVIQKEEDYPEALRLKYYRPDVKVYLYEAVSVTDWRCADSRGRQQDAFYSNSPIGFKYVLDNHPEWLYPDPNSRNPKYDMKSPPFRRLRATTRHYFTHLDNPEYQDLWASRTVDKATRYRLDGVWIDALEVAGEIGRRENEVQSFLHAVVPRLHEAGLDVIHNAATVNVVSTPGRVFFDPWWKPSGGRLEESGCKANSPDSTADGLYNEWSFFKHWPVDGVDMNHYQPFYWYACLKDMDEAAEWNTAEGERALKPNRKKWVHCQIHGVDRPGDSAYGPRGWAQFGLCTYLLGQNQWTTLGASLADDAYTALRPDYDIRLGTPAGPHRQVGSDMYFRVRDYHGTDGVNPAPGGCVIVNGYPDEARVFTAHADFVTQAGGYVPYASPISIKPHTGLVLFHQSNYRYVSVITSPLENQVVGTGECTIEGRVYVNRSGLELPDRVQVRVDSGEWTDCAVDSSGRWSFRLRNWEPGIHSVWSRVYNDEDDFEPEKRPRTFTAAE